MQLAPVVFFLPPTGADTLLAPGQLALCGGGFLVVVVVVCIYVVVVCIYVAVVFADEVVVVAMWWLHSTCTMQLAII